MNVAITCFLGVSSGSSVNSLWIFFAWVSIQVKSTCLPLAQVSLKKSISAWYSSLYFSAVRIFVRSLRVLSAAAAFMASFRSFYLLIWVLSTWKVWYTCPQNPLVSHHHSDSAAHLPWKLHCASVVWFSNKSVMSPPPRGSVAHALLSVDVDEGPSTVSISRWTSSVASETAVWTEGVEDPAVDVSLAN